MSDPAMSDPAGPSPLAGLASGLAACVAAAAPGLVSVQSHRARSSGFVWRPGLIVTADEALAEDGEIAVVLPGGECVPARVAGRDPTTDIALLRIDHAGLAPIPLAMGAPSVGALALVVGAQDGGPTAAFGIVSLAGGAWRSMRGGEIDARIELDLSLRRGAEGGVALAASGQAFGMAVLGPRRRVLVIPAATIERVAARLEQHGRIGRGYLGLGLQSVRLEDGGAGVMVMTLDPNGPGLGAGLRQGDVITAWDGTPVRSVQAVFRALGPDSVGTSVRVGFRRAEVPAELTLTIGERPEA